MFLSSFGASLAALSRIHDARPLGRGVDRTKGAYLRAAVFVGNNPVAIFPLLGADEAG